MLSINGQKKKVDFPLSLHDALIKFEYNVDDAFAVAVNKNLVNKIYYTTKYLQDGDEIDIVYPMQGG